MVRAISLRPNDWLPLIMEQQPHSKKKTKIFYGGIAQQLWTNKTFSFWCHYSINYCYVSLNFPLFRLSFRHQWRDPAVLFLFFFISFVSHGLLSSRLFRGCLEAASAAGSVSFAKRINGTPEKRRKGMKNGERERVWGCSVDDDVSGFGSVWCQIFFDKRPRSYTTYYMEYLFYI